MRLEVSGKTHVGKVRTCNEDNLLLMQDQNLFCVADGMGGHASGEIASKIAVDEVSEFFKYSCSDRDATWPFKMDANRSYDENRLATAVKLANRRIYETSQTDSRFDGMGTTLVATCFFSDLVLVGHVGDSRVYRFSAEEKKLEQLTEDHSLLNDYIKAHKLTPEQIEKFPHKNVIVRALGMKETVIVDVGRAVPKENDLFLLCSDGLSGLVSHDKICEVLRNSTDLDAAAEKLIEAANLAGGTDNVTCVLVRWHAN